MSRGQKIKDALFIIVIWLFAILLVYIVYLKLKILFNI